MSFGNSRMKARGTGRLENLHFRCCSSYSTLTTRSLQHTLTANLTEPPVTSIRCHPPTSKKVSCDKSLCVSNVISHFRSLLGIQYDPDCRSAVTSCANQGKSQPDDPAKLHFLLFHGRVSDRRHMQLQAF